LVQRLKESIRRIEADAELVHALRHLSATAFHDRRFGLFVSMLLDSGCRKSEILERTWSNSILTTVVCWFPIPKMETPVRCSLAARPCATLKS
jgi:integrase